MDVQNERTDLNDHKAPPDLSFYDFMNVSNPSNLGNSVTLLYLWENKLPDDSLGLSKDCKHELLAMQNFVSGT